MDKGFAMVIGMSIAYIASFLGLLLAWHSYRKHHKEREWNEIINITSGRAAVDWRSESWYYNPGSGAVDINYTYVDVV